MNLAKEAFHKRFVNKVNFLTEDVIKYGTALDFYWELSTGTFLNGRIFGVTVIYKYPSIHYPKKNNLVLRREKESSKQFDTYEDACDHIHKIGGEIKKRIPKNNFFWHDFNCLNFPKGINI